MQQVNSQGCGTVCVTASHTHETHNTHTPICTHTSSRTLLRLMQRLHSLTLFHRLEKPVRSTGDRWKRIWLCSQLRQRSRGQPTAHPFSRHQSCQRGTLQYATRQPAAGEKQLNKSHSQANEMCFQPVAQTSSLWSEGVVASEWETIK